MLVNNRKNNFVLIKSVTYDGCLLLPGIEVIFLFTYVALYMKRENRLILGFVED